MDYSVFLKPEIVIVVAVLIFIGAILKGIKKMPDELIPVMLALFGIVIASLIMGKWTIESVIQGIIAAACAVYGNQVVKQATKLNQVVDNEIDKTIENSK